MGKIKHILVPIDFSDASLNALQYAIELSKQYGAKISLIHAFRLIQTDDLSTNLGHDIRNIISGKIENQFNDLISNYSSVEGQKLNYSTQLGFLNDVLENFISNNSTELIVMGSTGIDKKPFFLAETLSSVINVVEVPILIVPPEVDYKKWNHVLSNASGDEPNKENHKISSLFKDRNIYIKEGTHEGAHLKQIIFEEQVEIDLLALNSMDFKKLGQFLYKNLNTDLLRPVSIPMLIHS